MRILLILRLYLLQFSLVVAVTIAVIALTGLTSKEENVVFCFHGKSAASVEVEIGISAAIGHHRIAVFQQSAAAKFVYHTVQLTSELFGVEVGIILPPR